MREYIATGKCKGKDLPEAVVNAAMAAEHDAEVPERVELDGKEYELMFCTHCGACVAVVSAMPNCIEWSTWADDGLIPCCDNPDYWWATPLFQPSFPLPESTVTVETTVELRNPYHDVNSLLYRRCAKAWDEGAAAVAEQVVASLAELRYELNRTMEVLDLLRKDGE